MTKDELRTYFKKQRADACAPEKSAAILNRLLALDAYQNARTVMTYLSFRDEVNTHMLAQRILKDGKTLYVPVCNSADCTITPARIDDVNRELATGHFGIPEPMTVRPAAPESIDLTVVPGVAFDRTGHRIGFGRGYYDRFLPLLSPSATTAGLAFEACLFQPGALPHEPHDIPVQMVITELETIDTKGETHENTTF